MLHISLDMFTLQVWAIICEFLGDMQPESRERLKGWLYDDMCHLMPYAGIKDLSNLNPSMVWVGLNLKIRIAIA